MHRRAFPPLCGEAQPNATIISRIGGAAPAPHARNWGHHRGSEPKEGTPPHKTRWDPRGSPTGVPRRLPASAGCTACVGCVLRARAWGGREQGGLAQSVTHRKNAPFGGSKGSRAGLPRANTTRQSHAPACERWLWRVAFTSTPPARDSIAPPIDSAKPPGGARGAGSNTLIPGSLGSNLLLGHEAPRAPVSGRRGTY